MRVTTARYLMPRTRRRLRIINNAPDERCQMLLECRGMHLRISWRRHPAALRTSCTFTGAAGAAGTAIGTTSWTANVSLMAGTNAIVVGLRCVPEFLLAFDHGGSEVSEKGPPIPKRGLLILDGVEDWIVVQECLPATKRGHVLITTRLQHIGTVARGVE